MSALRLVSRRPLTLDPAALSVPEALALMKSAPELYRELYVLTGELCARDCPMTGHLDDCTRRNQLLADAHPPAPTPESK